VQWLSLKNYFINKVSFVLLAWMKQGEGLALDL
jgi:hypothetical protein